MTRGNLQWLLWYVQMLAEGRALQPETHNLAREKIAHDLDRLKRVTGAMRRARRAKREKSTDSSTVVLE